MEEEKEVRDLGRIRSGEIGAIVEKYIPKEENRSYSPNAMMINSVVVVSIIASMSEEQFAKFLEQFEYAISKMKFRDKFADEMALAGKGRIIV